MSDVLDVACSTGNVVLEYASIFTNVSFDSDLFYSFEVKTPQKSWKNLQTIEWNLNKDGGK
ncbi:hypothetical protein HUE87_04300 [Candidatus Sulfurimonas marisnigri]|uniref:Uncharacterized protein n=1 Tax=Candidatus Sulfurimonas marisnigri TaxID=2740405 RepID=A0A7S7M1R3_9BACT|nr:hypothetical protein [Candidatus Sulfurimonas marisnigri]QOY55462.1 hypothetical protein HUE87_04300 [Candidatus Sulfurimonas marisnigri]